MIEKDIVDLLDARLAAEVYYGMQPQPPDNVPAPLPVVIVNRVASVWYGGLCGTDTDLSRAGIQVDYYDETAEGARRLADQGRIALRDLVASSAGGGLLDSEISYYDEESRGWRVQQRWDMADYSPALS
ncbi:DUF3168 domain-containing protein [Sinorhizobium medicae WSM1115]|uniref:DUF3168 domain-containing protein n=1 Tax=Sinorhizobium medicae TaxID=110321 RepID=UPI00037B02A0|nr:DUF3168 domain-containing protein [Sinorhizobium medicae]UFX03602.1 DUF3168 domain-containing protein [Sinorhizobium medicae WSM1115]